MLRRQKEGDSILRRQDLSESVNYSVQKREDDLPTVDDIMKCPLSKFIYFAANDCGYTGTRKELVVNWIHPLFLKAKSEASKEDKFHSQNLEEFHNNMKLGLEHKKFYHLMVNMFAVNWTGNKGSQHTVAKCEFVLVAMCLVTKFTAFRQVKIATDHSAKSSTGRSEALIYRFTNQRNYLIRLSSSLISPTPALAKSPLLHSH